MNLSKLSELDLLNLAPISLVLDTPIAYMTKPCFFIAQTNASFSICCIYVDNMIITGDDLTSIH
jgi:hypothetical protein